MTNRRYTLEFEAAARREMGKLPREAQQRIRAATEALRDDPRPAGVVKMSGGGNFWRIRVGDYRVVYTVADSVLVITVVRIGNRRDVYRM